MERPPVLLQFHPHCQPSKHALSVFWVYQALPTARYRVCATAHRIAARAGAISEPEVITQFLVLLAGGLGVSFVLDRWAGHEQPILLYLAIFGSLISYIYSAPPLKLKQSGWAGNYALGSSYIALPWWAGQVRMSTQDTFNPSRSGIRTFPDLECILEVIQAEQSPNRPAWHQERNATSWRAWLSSRKTEAQ